jgi:hypothetical protein
LAASRISGHAPASAPRRSLGSHIQRHRRHRHRAVSGDSVNLLSGHYGTSGNTWATAAFEFDGVTGIDSVNIISGAYGRGLAGNAQYPPL